MLGMVSTWMGDCLGIPCAVDIRFCVFHFIIIFQTVTYSITFSFLIVPKYKLCIPKKAEILSRKLESRHLIYGPEANRGSAADRVPFYKCIAIMKR